MKIPVRLKIAMESKNYDRANSLRITPESKNYYLKILVRVCMRVCMRVYMCGQIAIRTQHTRGTHDRRNTDTRGREETAGKGRNTSNAGKSLYIGIFADNEKKYKKS